MTSKELVEQLTEKNNKNACAASAELAVLSAQTSEIYPYMNYFFSILEDKNSLVRNRVLMLISANAKWDREDIIGSQIEKYLEHIADEKPITARQCIKFLPEIARAKPELSERILSALDAADFSRYAESMSPLLERDASSAKKIIRENQAAGLN